MKDANAKVQQKRRLVRKGLMQVDENGQETLTDKGRAAVVRAINSLPDGEEFLIELAVFEGHGISVYAN